VRKEKIIIIFTVLVDVIGFGIVIPILPFYVGEFGASATTITLMFASFSCFSFLSSPFLGALSDRIGRRPLLITSIASTAVGWFVFAGATTIPMLFLGRIIDGAAAGNFSIAQSYLVDISENDKERTTNLGIIGAAFGIGFMLGPLIGGLLSTVSHAFPFWFAGGLATVNACVAYFYLPETLKHRNTDDRLRFNPLRPLMNAVRDTALRPLYISWIMFALAFVTSQSVFALFVGKNFGFDSFTTGLTFTAMGLIVAINQVGLLKHLWLRRFTEPVLEVMMLSSLLIGFLLFTAKTMTTFVISALFISTGQSVLRVILTSQVAGAAEPKTKGEKMGILSSLMAASMVVGPVIAGPLYEIHDTLPYFAAGGYILTALVFALTYQRRARTAAEVVRVNTVDEAPLM